jgi:hypothetical protein
MKKFTCFIILICIFLGACKKPVQYSEIPEIKFISYEQHQESYDINGEILIMDCGTLTYYFQDGDGDLGLDASDLKLPPFNTFPYSNNFFCDCYEKRNGIFEKIIVPDTMQGFNGCFPRLSKLSKESINGELYHKMVSYHENSPYDTVKLVFYIVDRALHHSNVEEVVVIRQKAERTKAESTKGRKDESTKGRMNN